MENKPLDFYQRRAQQLAQLPNKKCISKYKNKITIVDGYKFSSRLEADFYQNLMILKRAGDVEFFLRQVPMHLAPGSKLVVDFLVKYKNDPDVRFIETKGCMTSNALTKIKIAEHKYGVKIEIVKKN